MVVDKKIIENLEKLLGTIKDENSFNRLTNIMNSKDMREIIDCYLEDSYDNKELSNSEKELLSIILRVCNSIYNNSGSDTGMSDSEYDVLVEYYKKVSGDSLPITESISSGKVVHHRYKTLRGTLDKIYKITEEDVIKNSSQKSLKEWIKQAEKRYFMNSSGHIDLLNCDVITMPKFDGVSCILEFSKDGVLERALTRGDTGRNEAQDITHIFRNMVFNTIKNAKYPYAVKTEIMMKESDLEEVNKLSSREYKNTRSIVSSIINSDEVDERVKYLQVVQLRYSYLIDGKESRQYLCDDVYNYPYVKCKLKDFDTIRDFSIKHKYINNELRCDGSVIQILDEKVQDILGREDEKQKYEVAFKYTEEVGYSKVKDVEFTTGLFGRINPVVVFKPIKLKGNTIERASLGSYARFKELNLVKGDIIKIYYDIIPYVTMDDNDIKCHREVGAPIKEPTHCYDCGSYLEPSESGDILSCTNDKCPSREKGRILNYCKKMNIGNISYATIEDLYREGFLYKIEDLYILNEHKKDISKLNGYGENKINKIIDEIESHKDVIPSVLLGSIGIEGISTKTFENILSYITMDEILYLCKDNNVEFFTDIPGIKDKTSKKLIKGINSSRELISSLRKILNVLPEPRKNSSLFKVVFTKVRDDSLEDYIKEMGGEVCDSVTKSTNIVVVPVKNISSSKVEKAKKYNIPIVVVDDLKNFIETNY